MDQAKSVPADEPARSTYTAPTKNIVELLISAGNFGTLAACVKTAGLAVALADKGPFTVFAPTDEAFKKLQFGAYEELLKDPGKLKAILNYHVVSGYLTAADMKSGEMMTLQGSSLTGVVSSSEVRVNGARIMNAELAGTNGIVHAIDAVLLPKNWRLLARSAS